jgi:hypothetical protein
LSEQKKESVFINPGDSFLFAYYNRLLNGDLMKKVKYSSKLLLLVTALCIMAAYTSCVKKGGVTAASTKIICSVGNVMLISQSGEKKTALLCRSRTLYAQRPHPLR